MVTGLPPDAAEVLFSVAVCVLGLLVRFTERR